MGVKNSYKSGESDGSSFLMVLARRFNINRYGLFCRCGRCIQNREEYFYFRCPICRVDTPYCKARQSGILGASICERCYHKGYDLLGDK